MPVPFLAAGVSAAVMGTAVTLLAKHVSFMMQAIHAKARATKKKFDADTKKKIEKNAVTKTMNEVNRKFKIEDEGQIRKELENISKDLVEDEAEKVEKG